MRHQQGQHQACFFSTGEMRNGFVHTLIGKTKTSKMIINLLLIESQIQFIKVLIRGMDGVQLLKLMLGKVTHA